MTTTPTKKTLTPAQLKDQAELQNRLGSIKKLLADGATGPLRAAEGVITLAAEWETKFRVVDELDEDFQTFLRRTLGRGRTVRWFQVRKDAVDAFGLRDACLLHHDAAVWLHQRGLSKGDIQRVLLRAVGAYKAQGNNPLTRPQLLRVFVEVMGERPRMPKSCAGCAERDELIAKLRAELAALKGSAAK